MRIERGRQPMTEAESAALDRLLAEYGERASATRRDPGETGPLVVQVGGRTFLIDGDETREV